MKIENRTKENKLYNKVYYLWYNMKRRCYNQNADRYQNYKEITVCKKWLELNDFIDDIDKIQGFNIEQFLKGELTLDKDNGSLSNKEYNLINCSFISRVENNKVKPNQQKYFIGTDPNGKSYEAFNQSEFAREHGLAQKNISLCLNKKQKTHKGWYFEYE